MDAGTHAPGIVTRCARNCSASRSHTSLGGPNYLVGLASNIQYRDFFVFDLAAVTRPIIGTHLQLFNPASGYSSPSPSDTYSVFSVSTPIPTLRAFGTGQTAIFNDLGSGTSLGAQTVSTADNGRVIPIDLNADAVNYLNAHRGGLAAVGGAITTITGSADRYLFAFSGNTTDTRRLVLDLGTPAGPTVTASTPSGNGFGIVSSVRFTFDSEIDAATFTPDKIAHFTRTDGAGVTDLMPTVLGVTPVPGSGNHQFDVTFASQFRLGRYAMTIGPDIRDLAGHQMDQNFNGVAGEIPDDEYTATFAIQGPRITASTPTGNFLGQVGNVTVTFNEPINAATFTGCQVSLTGPGGSIAVSGIYPVAGSNNTRFVVTFAPQSTTGTYAMRIGPTVEDLYGHRMDQNQNFLEGENPDDIYTASFGIQGPKIIASTPSGIISGSVGSVRVTFNEAMNAASFTPNQVSFTGPSGPIAVSYITVVPGTGGTQFDIVFATQTTLGDYALVIGPDIRDLYGNAMDQNGNLITGEIPGDQYTASFTLSTQRLLEDFETGGLARYSGAVSDWSVTAAAAHDGNLGLHTTAFGGSSAEWIYRNDTGAHVQQGDLISAWTRMNSMADGRVYFGFGASSLGTLCLILAPNSGELILEENANFNFLVIGTTSQTYLADHWYRLEVEWRPGGDIVGRLFDSDGTTLLRTVTAHSTLYTEGGIAFRGFSNSTGSVDFDTVTALPLSGGPDLGGGTGGTAGLTLLVLRPLHVRLLEERQQVIEYRGIVPRSPAVGRAEPDAGQVRVGIDVGVDRNPDLPEVVLAGGSVGRLAHFLDGGQQ